MMRVPVPPSHPAVQDVKAWLDSVEPEILVFIATTLRPSPDAILAVLDARGYVARVAPELAAQASAGGALCQWMTPEATAGVFALAGDELDPADAAMMSQRAHTAPPEGCCWQLVVHGPSCGLIPRPLVSERSAAKAHQPDVIKHGGEYALNAAAVLRVMHDTDPNDSKDPAVRAAVRKFRERVKAEVARGAVLAVPPTLDDVMAKVGNLDRLNALIKSNGLTTSALIALLNGESVN